METKKFEAKKSLGQHFLTSPAVPRWMCDAAEIVVGDIVLEIGPGTGVLTLELLNRGATVIAFEADERALLVLRDRFASEIHNGKLILHHTDVRTLDLRTIKDINDHSFKVVANIPYYLSGLLFRMMLESPIQPQSLVYLVQKEVAKRITQDCEHRGKESILSLSVKAYGSPKYVKTVLKGHFNPPPKIDSAIILVQNLTRDNFKNLDEKFFFEILHIGFGQKRKQLLGNLSKFYDRTVLTHIFSTVDIPTATRAEDIPLKKWLILCEALAIHRQ
jgi:16S rRNA (adenine1518-N6/adenine1519-N6)-dimethyltransferase